MSQSLSRTPTAPNAETSHDAGLEIVPASNFSVEALNEAYNQARADYLIAMPMTVAQLESYIFTYDVALEHSAVAMEGEKALGLAMLGVRLPHTWITRLGIVQVKRRHGTGQRLMDYLIAHSWQLEADTIILEVIKNNVPAYQLFCKLGFQTTRELLILQRPANITIPTAPRYSARRLAAAEALAWLVRRRDSPSWLNDTRSLQHMNGIEGLEVHLDSGEWGWVVYQRVASALGHLTLQAETPDGEAVISALLHALHTAYPDHETRHENLPAGDFCYPMLERFGYTIAFERIEMRMTAR